VPDETRSKLDDKAKECKLIGYEGDSIYVVVDASKKKLCSHNVIFIEGTDTCTDGTKPKSMEFQSQDTKTNEDDSRSVHSAGGNDTAK